MYNQSYENVCTMKCMHNENKNSIQRQDNLQTRYNIRNENKYAFAFNKQKVIQFSISKRSHELAIDNDP